MIESVDFSRQLLDALQAEPSAEQGPRQFMKSVLALRAWFRHMALVDKPELVVQQTAEVFEVYGNARLVRNDTGHLEITWRGETQPMFHIELARIGHFLARKARYSIHEEYFRKAQVLVETSDLSPAKVDTLLVRLKDASEFLRDRLNVNWWRRKCTMADDARVLGKLLWSTGIIDREVFGLAVRLDGFSTALNVYNMCLANKAGFQARVLEAPHMAPWLRRWESPDTLDVHQNVWADLKTSFMALGGTKAAWRWFCSQGYTWFKRLPLLETNVQTIVAISTLQLGKVPYHQGLVDAIRGQALVSRWSSADLRYLDVFKAAVVAHKKRKLKVADFQQIVLISDFLRNVPDASTKGATWSSLMRKQQAWHMEQARIEMARRKEEGGCLGWAPFVQTVTDGALEAVSLNNSDELWEEGSAMTHCVGGYEDQCYRNRSRIYSIRRNGERVSTLEIHIDDGGKLLIRQNYGIQNMVIRDPQVLKFAQRVLSACRRAPKLNAEDNYVIRKPRRVKQVKPREVLPPPEQLPEFEDEDLAIPF